MDGVRRLSEFTGRWFALIVVAAGALGLAVPGAFDSMTVAVPWLLALIMFGMGMTLRLADFAIVGKRPWALLAGVAAQYVVMPLLALGLAWALHMSTDLAVGMVLVGAAPGGTSSNVMVFLSRGDTALSVAMTSVSTLLAPFLTPLLILALAGHYLPVDVLGLFVSILKIVLAPVVLGLVLRMLVPRLIERCLDVLPLISVVGITLVVLAVVASSSATLLTAGGMVVAAVVLHNLGGLALGYGASRLCRLPRSSRRAVSIEVGLQNSGLAASLATAHFNPAAALPAAIFSVWHNISGPILASYWRRKPPADAVSAERTDDAAAPAPPVQ